MADPISTASKEYRSWPVIATVAGVPVNPTTGAVALAFKADGTVPLVGDFVAATWVTTPSGYTARILIGTGGDVVLAAGHYRVWLKVTDTPEIPVLPIDTLTVTAAFASPPANQWVSGPSLLSDPRIVDADMPPDVSLDMCAASATEYLYKRTGRRYRIFTVTMRPNAINVCGCSIDECFSSRELTLDGPVAPGSLVVVVDGVTLASTAYKLYDGHLLVRQDGGYWPTCSHLSAPTGMAGTMSVTYTRGQLPTADLVLACRELAIHVALALSGKPSKIPARATGVQRRGLSLNLLRGLNSTGIPLVDDACRAANPHNLIGRGSVMSPDTVRLSRS